MFKILKKLRESESVRVREKKRDTQSRRRIEREIQSAEDRQTDGQ
jgi:hypothetical protein